jgi:hypothetical protein
MRCLVYASFVLCSLVLPTIALAEVKTFNLGSFDRAVYCTITDMQLEIRSPPDGNEAFLRFNQQCSSSRSDQQWVGPWTFTVNLLRANGARVSTLTFYYSHRCGFHFIELNQPIRPLNTITNTVRYTADANVNWQFYDRVHGC